MKDHEIREPVNRVQELCLQYRDTEQLRERIANFLVPVLKAAPVEVAQAVTPVPEKFASLFDFHSDFFTRGERFMSVHGARAFAHAILNAAPTPTVAADAAAPSAGRQLHTESSQSLAQQGTEPGANLAAQPDERAAWPMLAPLHLEAIMFAYNEGWQKAYDGREFANPFAATGSQAAAWEAGARDGKERREIHTRASAPQAASLDAEQITEIADRVFTTRVDDLEVLEFTSIIRGTQPDERAAFEAWMQTGVLDSKPDLSRDDLDNYDDWDTQRTWRGWQARAGALQTVAQPDASFAAPECYAWDYWNEDLDCPGFWDKQYGQTWWPDDNKIPKGIRNVRPLFDNYVAPKNDIDAFGFRFRVLCSVAADMQMDKDQTIEEIRKLYSDNPEWVEETNRQMPTEERFAKWVDDEARALLRALKEKNNEQ